MTAAAISAPMRATRLERALLALSGLLNELVDRRMRLRAATAGRRALQVAAADRERDVAAAVHVGMLPR